MTRKIRTGSSYGINGDFFVAAVRSHRTAILIDARFRVAPRKTLLSMDPLP